MEPRSKRTLDEIRAVGLLGNDPFLSKCSVEGILGNISSCRGVSSRNINHLIGASIRKRNIALVVMGNDPALGIAHIRRVQLDIGAVIFRSARNIQDK